MGFDFLSNFAMDYFD